MAQDSDLVAVHRAAGLAEAEVVCSVLEGAGLYAILPCGNTLLPGVSEAPFDPESTTASWVVCVRAADLNAAREVLAEARAAGKEASLSEPEAMERERLDPATRSELEETR